MWNGEAFANPAAQYRIHPFWFWNGDMEEEQIKRQVNEMSSQGVGGFHLSASGAADPLSVGCLV